MCSLSFVYHLNEHSLPSALAGWVTREQYKVVAESLGSGGKLGMSELCDLPAGP